MPGATTARLVFFEAAIDWKLFMMPQTVPNSPTNGAVEPTEARKVIRFSSVSLSREMVRAITCSLRWRRLAPTSLPRAVHPRADDRPHSPTPHDKTPANGAHGGL